MIPAARYPWLAGYLRQREGQAAGVVALLGEDGYETLFGDGRFYYLRNVFRTAEEAQRNADAHHEDWLRTAPPDGRNWRQFHLRAHTLALHGDEIVLRGFVSYAPDQFTAEDIVHLFTARYGLGRVASRERWWYVAWDAQWVVSFGDFENVYCYSDAAVTELLAMDARAASISRVAAMRGDKPGPSVSRRDWLSGERLVLK